MQHNSQSRPDHTSPSAVAKPWYKRSVILIILALIIVASGVGVLLFARKDPRVPVASQKLTLYYNDGKTPFWQTGQEENENDAAFIAYVRNQLKLKHGEDYQSKGAWSVTTTLDKRLQDAASQQFKDQRLAISRAGMTSTVLAAEDATNGQIVSLVTQQIRPTGTNPIAERIVPGTLVTPFSYIALLEKKPESVNAVFEDTQSPLAGYPCTNHSAPKQGGNCLFNLDMRYLGALSLSQALGGFRNVTAVKAALETGPDTYDIAAKMGSDGACYLDNELTKKTACHAAAVFGEGIYATPQRLLQAYATLANKGAKLPQDVLLKTVLNDKPQYVWQKSSSEQVIRSQTATTISNILADPGASLIPESHKDVFSRNDGKKVSVVSGYARELTRSSSIQFTDRYVVGFWGGASAELAGNHVQSVSLPMASGLLKTTGH